MMSFTEAVTIQKLTQLKSQLLLLLRMIPCFAMLSLPICNAVCILKFYKVYFIMTNLMMWLVWQYLLPFRSSINLLVILFQLKSVHHCENLLKVFHKLLCLLRSSFLPSTSSSTQTFSNQKVPWKWMELLKLAEHKRQNSSERFKTHERKLYNIWEEFWN